VAQEAHKDGLDQIEDNLKGRVEGEAINVTRIRSSGKSCVDSIVSNPNALTRLNRLRSKNNYIAVRCLNAGILAIAFEYHLGMGGDELATLGLCGML